MPYYYSNYYYKYFHKTVTGKIIIANTIVFLIQMAHLKINSVPFDMFFGLCPTDVLQYKFWQIFTYMFLHADFLHLFFNMFSLFFFGLELERLWGSKELLKYYLTCGVGAALFSFFFVHDYVYIIGASGAIFGVFLAYGLIYPEREVLFFFIYPIKIKYALIILSMISMFLMFNNNSNIAHFTHLGGLVIGYLYLKHAHIANKLEKFKINRQDKKRKSKIEKLESQINKMQEDVDALLVKISNHGLNSLTEKERKVLLKASELIKQKDEI